MLKIEALIGTLKEFFGMELGFGSSPDLTRIVNKRHFSRLVSYLKDLDVDKTIVYGGKYNEDTLYVFELSFFPFEYVMDEWTCNNQMIFKVYLRLFTCCFSLDLLNQRFCWIHQQMHKL